MEREIEEIRQQKANELRQRMEEQKKAEEQDGEMEAKIDLMLKTILSPEAKQRIGNVRLVNKEVYLQAAQTLIYLAQSNKLKEKISDIQLKQLLAKISGRKKEIKIKRK